MYGMHILCVCFPSSFLRFSRQSLPYPMYKYKYKLAFVCGLIGDFLYRFSHYRQISYFSILTVCSMPV